VALITIIPLSEGHQCSNEVPGALLTQGLHAQFIAPSVLDSGPSPFCSHIRGIIKETTGIHRADVSLIGTGREGFPVTLA